MSLNIIYNLAQYLENFALGTIGTDLFINVRFNSPDELTIISETGGTEKAWDGFTQQAIQIYNRAVDMVTAMKNAKAIYEEINNRFGVLLPLANVSGDIYPALKIAQISSNSLPQSIGEDENGRCQVSTNYRFIFGR